MRTAWLRPPLPAASEVGPERPVTAYRVLERRATLTTAGLLLGLAALAWWSTARSAAGMDDMVLGLADVPTAMPFDMTGPLFLAMWVTMMVAMMFPTVAPVVLLHRLVMRRRGVGPAPTVAFVGGYLLVWALAGLVPLAVLVAFAEVGETGSWVERLAGGVLVVAGAYQFTRWKARCQSACRSPLTFLATHDFGTGLRGTARVGASHGLYCLGCCWALMAVLFAVGLMNLAWMAAIAVVFLAEKHWQHAPLLAWGVGAGLVLLGAAVVLDPGLLPGAGADPMPMEPSGPGEPMDGMPMG